MSSFRKKRLVPNKSKKILLSYNPLTSTSRSSPESSRSGTTATATAGRFRSKASRRRCLQTWSTTGLGRPRWRQIVVIQAGARTHRHQGRQ